MPVTCRAVEFAIVRPDQLRWIIANVWRATTPLQIVNEGDQDLLVYAYGSPPDDGAELLPAAV